LHSNRGTGSDIVVVDEIRWVPAEYLKSVILPTLINGGIFIAMTSEKKNSTEDFVTTMENAKRPDGTRIVKCLRMEMVCLKCKRGGFREEICIHMDGYRPKFQKTARINDLSIIMGDDKDDFITEIQGIAVNSNERSAFKKDDVLELEDKDNFYSGKEEFTDVFFGVDPSGGGAKSRYTMIAMAQTRSGEIVVRFMIQTLIFFIITTTQRDPVSERM
jgi:hypothetical protein